MRQKSSPPFKENGANVIHRLDDDPSESHITARFSLRILPISLVKLGASFLVTLSFSASRFSKGVRNRVEVEASEISSYRFPSIKKKSFFRLEPKMNEQVLKEFYIPKYILVPDSKAEELPRAPSSPVVVFINSKSGGQLGGDLLQTYRQLLSEAQVAGGDGTASWLLGVVSDLKLTRAPPIATVPLGTGNNLPFSFGWGKKNPGTDRLSVEHFLDKVMKAREMKIDSWHIIMRMRAPKEGSCDPIAPLELPHSLHAFHRVSHTDSLNVEGYDTFRGGFWNYFSMGMDAQVSYAFHSERKLHPEKFKN